MARPKGSPNRSTEQVRRAIASLLEMSAPRMIEWLQKVADGIPEKDEEGKQVGWINKPDPASATNLVLKAAEFHIPKLARTEMVGDPDKPLFISKIELVPMNEPRTDQPSE